MAGQLFQYRHRMFGRIEFGRPQIGHQQLVSAEHVQRQVAVVVVVAMKETFFLVAMQGDATGIEIENQFCRRPAMGGDELAHDFGLYLPRQRSRGAPLEAAQHRLCPARFAVPTQCGGAGSH